MTAKKTDQQTEFHIHSDSIHVRRDDVSRRIYARRKSLRLLNKLLLEKEGELSHKLRDNVDTLKGREQRASQKVRARLGKETFLL